jgi:ribosome-associated heat shock protein Hsp15
MTSSAASTSVVRVDKWLQVARVFKTRSQATRACSQGRVRVNGLRAKAHRALAIDDRVEVDFGETPRILVVKELRDRPLPRKEAHRVFEDHSPPRPRRDAIDRALEGPGVQRERGLGRPTKRQRREMNRFRSDS